MHPVYMSLGNIHKKIRHTISRRPWILLAKLPVLKFAKSHLGTTKTEKKKTPGILHQRLFHHCMRIILAPLRKDRELYFSAFGLDGLTWWCLVVLMVWVANLEERLMIVGVKSFHCPICMASKGNLQDPVCHHT
jgi:hypothetical protein